jgi:tRNA-dihydrouridine synthase
MTARAALIRPWIFREHTDGYRDLDAEARVAIYRRYVTLAREYWGDDDHGLVRVRQFTRWHLDFWCREARRREDGSFPSMQARETDSRQPRSALEALLGRSDGAALEYLADCLTWEREIDPRSAPAPGDEQAVMAIETEG